MYKLIASLWLVLGVAGTAVAATPSPSPSPASGPAPTVGSAWISEFLPNPTGTDTGNEWVELYNRADQPIDFSGLLVVRQSGSALAAVPAGSLVAPGGYLKLVASGSIVNGGDTIILKNATAELDRVTYDANGEEGESWARISETEGGWTPIPTAGEANRFPEPTPEPAAGPVPEAPAGGGAGTAAVTKAPAAKTAKKTAKAPAAKKASAKKEGASKLPASGLPAVAYLLPVVLGALYWYGRIAWRRRHHARQGR